MQLPVIKLQRIEHRGVSRLFLFFRYNQAFISKVKAIPGARWSATRQGWHVSDDESTLQQIRTMFTNTARLDDSSLKHPAKSVDKRAIRKEESITAKYKQGLTPAARLHIDKMTGKLKALGYADNTVNIYRNVMEIFLGFLKKDVGHLEMDDVVLFQVKHYSKGGYAGSTQRQFIAALKHLLEAVPGGNIKPERLELPKKEKHLPSVLSQQEMMSILGGIRNLKHFLMLSLMYSSGLRIGELLNLKIEDISLERRQIHIRQSKGKKDRYVGISTYLVPTIRQYLRMYKPEVYLLNGQKGLQYSASSVRKVLQRAAKEAGIRKRVTPHMLRHSYATHLLESGVDIRYIQELLGHNKPETTMIYTHVTTKQLTDIKSPLDALVERFRDKGNDSDQKFLLSGK